MDIDVEILRKWIFEAENCIPKINVLEQGWGKLHFSENLMQNGPLNLAGANYEFGLATHADSRIRITTGGPLKKFRAWIGVDCNRATLAKSKIPRLIFGIEADGRELYQSPPLTIESEALLCEVELDGIDTFDLTVKSLDGLPLANADWCEPVLETVTGKRIEIGKPFTGLLPAAVPVNFRYEGLTAAEFFRQYPLRRQNQEFDDHTLLTCRGGNESLQMLLTMKSYHDFPAVEFNLAFENPSERRSGRLSEVRSLAVSVMSMHALTLCRRKGSFNLENEPMPASFRKAFCPERAELTGKAEYRFGGTDGKPTVDWLPCFDLTDGESNIRFVVGWAGQWDAQVKSDEDSLLTEINAGIELINTVLEPGERIELPSAIMVYNRSGGSERGVNIWRRFVLEKIAARIDGKVVIPPICSINWGGMTEEEHLQRIANIVNREIPFECHWIDAGWYGPPGSYSPDEFDATWGSNTGDWIFNSSILPNKLKKIAAASHAAGMKQLLWMEPERAVKNCRNFKEHPERYLTAPSILANSLLNLGDPDAWQYCFDTISNLIRENELDWFRQDFNISPLEAWRLNDAPDRRGITEIRYVAGLYKLWRSLREKFPHLMIDNCAGGGRRLDYNLMRYSLPLWSCDMECFPGFDPEWQLTHVAGLSEYLPLFSFGLQNQEGGDTYNFRASMGPGMVIHYFMYTYRKPDMPYPHEWLKERLAEYQRARACFTGDYYMLAAFHAEDAGAWTAMQFDRPDLGQGICTVFRGPNSPYNGGSIRLRGLAPETEYYLEDADRSFEPVVMTGRALMETGLPIRLEQPRSSRLVYYRVKA